MSNDKFEATYHGGYRYGGPVWNQAGTGISTQGDPNWSGNYSGPKRPERPKFPRGRLWIILVLAAGLVLALASILIERSNLVPAGVPVIGMDKGLAICKAMAGDKNPVGNGPGDELTTAEIRQVRQAFADSRYAEIREPGVKLMDMAAQIGQMSEDDMGLLMFASSFTESYAALSGGCSQHGYEIPALGT